MSDLLAEPAIDNPQQTFSLALGHLQRISSQAVDALQALAQDSQISPSVRLSAARTILQMSFKGAELFTFQSRLDHLETAATTLESEVQEDNPHSQPQPPSKIKNRKSEWAGGGRSRKPLRFRQFHSSPRQSSPSPAERSEGGQGEGDRR